MIFRRSLLLYWRLYAFIISGEHFDESARNIPSPGLNINDNNDEELKKHRGYRPTYCVVFLVFLLLLLLLPFVVDHGRMFVRMSFVQENEMLYDSPLWANCCKFQVSAKSFPCANEIAEVVRFVCIVNMCV